MDIQTLTKFFMWCTILSGSLLLFWSVVVVLIPDLVYRTQRMWFPFPRETWDMVIYSFLGLFKIGFLIFHLIPFLALTIISGS
ncbi:hypothetical protein HOF92_10075 [bacterium]|jgi:hypothetical protein|nr:hypothetical protein [bacterium]